jgi:hypothetical protein
VSDACVMAAQAVGHCGHRHDQGNGRVEEWGQHGGGGGMDTMWAPSLPTLQQHQQQHRNHYAPPRVRLLPCRRHYGLKSPVAVEGLSACHLNVFKNGNKCLGLSKATIDLMICSEH